MRSTIDEKKYRILLVDDDENILKMNYVLLESKGYEVITVGCGENALEALENEDFDLIITDLIMGKVNGLAVLKKAKELKPDRTVIIITGSRNVKHAIEAIRLDADDYLLKPFRAEDLLARISSCLKREASRQDKQISVA